MADVDILINPDQVDWTGVHKLLLDSYAYMAQIIDPPSSLHHMSVGDLQKKAQQETLLLARKSEAIVGCMFCREEGDWLYVGKVAVSGSCQGQGVGRLLFECAFKIARNNHQRGLELQSRIELIENHEIFQRFGFVKMGKDSHEGYDRPTSIRMRAEF